MGCRRPYRCDSCGLRATVSGGKDIGFYVETETRYCPDCQALDDVAIRLWCKEMLPGLLPSSRVDDLLESEERFGRCPSCGRAGGQAWVANSPCPRCGGVVGDTGEFIEQWI